MVLGLETVASQQDTLYFWQGVVLRGKLFFTSYVTSVYPLILSNLKFLIHKPVMAMPTL